MNLFARSGTVAAALAVLLLSAPSAAVPAAAASGAGPREPPAQAMAVPEGSSVARALDMRAMPALERIIPRLDRTRVVFVGETHDRLDHHLNQLEVIRGLHARRRAIAIGMEQFQQPFQGVLDDYVAGRISEREMLEGTEYFERWRFDYRLYRPILQYAREHGIPVVALNVPAEITTKIGREGLGGLSEAERAQVPADIDRHDEAYHARLRTIFEQHPRNGEQAFERWLEVQLTWDEGMAERAARYLNENPRRTLVVLAGSGHLAYRSGIPNRVARRTGVSGMVLLPVDGVALEPEVADFLLTSQARSLPPSGRLGIGIDAQEGRVRVASVEPNSGAEEAGVREGDEIVAIDGHPVARFSDVRLALWERSAGEKSTVEILRRRWIGPDEPATLTVTLR